MSVKRKDVLLFLTNFISKDLDTSKTEEFIVNLFDLNKNEISPLDKEETYFIRKRLGVLDDGVTKNYKDISLTMKLSELDVKKLEISALKKIKKDLDISYRNILISNIDFSIKAYGSLKDKSINTLGELLDRSIEELNKICYMNKQTVLEIIDKVHKMGYLFRDEIDFSIRKDIYFNNERIVSNLDNGREIYSFDYMDNFLLVCNIDSKTGLRTYMFDDKILKSVYLDNLLKKIGNFILINNNGKKVIEDDFNKYIKGIEIGKKNSIQNIVRKEFSSNIKYKEDDFDLINGFYDYLKVLYNNNLIKEFCKYFEFDKFGVCNFLEYYKLVDFLNRVIIFLEMEKEEINNEKNSLNKEKIKEIDNIKRVILEEKANLLPNIRNNYLKYATNDDFINASNEFVNKLFLDIPLSLKYDDNISISDIFDEIDPEIVKKEFYDLFNPIEGNFNIAFIVKFNSAVSKYCSKDNGEKYSEEESIKFLIEKYLGYTNDETNSNNNYLIDYINSELSGKRVKQ